MAFEEKKEKPQTDCKKVAINTLKRFEKRKRHITIEDIEDIASDNEISTQEVKELVFKLGIEYLMESGLPWYEDLARDEKLWRNRIFNEAPSIIACEYAGLRAMLFKGQVLGLPMKIKDVWETCLKFGVLALLSRQAHSFLTHDADEYAEVLGRLSEKALTLGGWIRLGRDALIIEKNKLNVQGASHELQEPIAKIFDVFNKLDSNGAISNWRNLYIGHGTFIEEENAKQRKLLEKQITLLANYFTATEEYYSQIEFYAMNDTDFIKLLWDKTQPNAILPFTDKALYLKQGEEIFQLLPFIRNYKHGIYFFDSYKRSKNETRYLDYPEGLQIVGIDDELTNLFERVIRRVKYNETIKHTFNESAEDEIYRLECEKALKRLLVPQKLHKMEFINSIIDKWIYDNDSGIFLLQMEQGMGKTTLAKMLDALSFESVPQMLKSNVVCRSISLNSGYVNTCNYFTSQLYNNLCQLDPTPEVPFDRLESINGLNAESENVAQQVSIFLRTVSEEYKKREGKEGVLLIIDGVDELSDIGIKSVLDLLPSNEDLPNNVYILLTSRINEEISSYTNRILKNIVFVDKYIVTRESEEYINSVRDCITKRLIKNSDENNATEIEYTSKLSDEILQLADRRMTSIDLLLRIYSSHPNIVLSDFTLIVDDYFTLLEQMYGSIYTNEIIRICTCLASVPIPLTINQLAGLLGYHYVSFEFLAYLGEIRPLLNVNKESDKPVLSLTRPEYISYLQKKTDILKTLRCDWKRDVLS